MPISSSTVNTKKCDVKRSRHAPDCYHRLLPPSPANRGRHLLLNQPSRMSWIACLWWESQTLVSQNILQEILHMTVCKKIGGSMPRMGTFWIRTTKIYQFAVQRTSCSIGEVLLSCNWHRSIVIRTSQYFLYTVQRTSASRYFFALAAYDMKIPTEILLMM